MAGITEYLTEGSRIFFTGVKSKFKLKEYVGDAPQICKQIVKECWNGKFFQVSTTNFPQFWCRDFGWCTQSLMKLGYEQEVRQTLKYALNRFQDAGKITTTITPAGKPYDFPTFAVDSIPWLIHSIKVSKFYYGNYKEFLNQQIQKLFDTAVSLKTGLVKSDLHVSSMKDFAVRKSSCYDNCVLAMLTKDLVKMNGLLNPFKDYDYEELLLKHFWNYEQGYFYDDSTKQNYVAGDANLFPFALGIVNDADKLHSALEAIQAAGLDVPLPLKYTAGRSKVNFIMQEVFMRDYESNTVWTHMGPLFIKLVKSANKWQGEIYQKKYTEMIEKLMCYPEVLTVQGEGEEMEVKLFQTPFYTADRGMLWAANYLTL
jgi:hypothetical protein